MKLKSIKDYNKLINITDTTLNCDLSSIEAALFSDDYLIDCKVTIGELLVLRTLKDSIINEHGLLISYGYKSN